MRHGPEPIFVLGVNWLVPGLGYALKGRLIHGLILFIVLNLTFVLGLMLYGSVTFPSFDSSAGAINWVNVLTFIGQLGNGGMSFFCVIHEKLGWSIYSYREEHAWSDLAALYFLVSGAMNYFSTCSLWDHFYKAGVAESQAK